LRAWQASIHKVKQRPLKQRQIANLNITLPIASMALFFRLRYGLHKNQALPLAAVTYPRPTKNI
jgi:hypothetical protein